MPPSDTDTFWVVNWSSDRCGRCNSVDPQWTRVTGQATASAIGKGWFETIHPDDREKLRADLTRAGEETRSFQVIARLRRADGQFRWALSVGAPTFDAEGAVAGFAGTLIDFHDRIIEQQTLAETRQRLEAVMDAAPIGLSYSTDPSCDYIVGNKATSAQLEIDVTDNFSASAPDAVAAGRQIRYRMDGRELTPAELPLQVSARERRKVDPVEIELELPSGRRRFVEASGAPIFAADGRVLGAVAVTVDVTEQKKSLEALRASEEQYRSLFETSRDGIVSIDLEKRITNANPAYRDMLGYTLEELRRLTYEEITPEIWHDAEAAIIREHTLPRGESGEYEKEYIRKDGTIFPVSMRNWTVVDEAGRIIGMRAFVRDISERRSSEAALRASERRMRAMLNHQYQYSALLTPDGRVIEISESVFRGTGFDRAEVAGKPFIDAPWWRDLPDTRAFWEKLIAEALGSAGPAHGEAAYRASDGALRYALNTLTALRDERGDLESLLVEGIDITERKQFEEALRQSRDDLDRAQQVGAIGSWRLDVRSNVLSWSDECHRIFGVPKGARLNYETFLSIVHPEDRENVDRQWRASLRGEPYDVEHRIVVKGQVKWVREKAYLEFDSEGALTGGFGVSQDITAQKKAGAALRDRELRYRTLVEATSAITWRCPSSGLHVEPQPDWMAFTGQTGEEMLGDGWTKAVHPDDRDIAAADWREAVRRGRPYDGELRVRRHDGQWRWMRVQAAPIRDAAGGIVEWFGSNTDINDLKQAELALRESQQQLSLALEAGQLGFWDWDISSGRAQFGGRWAAMLGYELSEIDPHVSVWEKLIHPDEREAVAARVSDHLEGRADFYECEHRLRHKDGSWRWILDRGQVVERDGAGRPLRAIGTHADVTARHEAEDALREADQRKDEFLAMLAHELRNPLTPIRTSLQIFRKSIDRTPTIDRLLDMMDRQTAHLVRLVDDLLEVSRITRGKIELRKERVDIAPIVEQAIDICRPLIEANRHALDISLPPAPLWLEADPVRVTQMLANLLNNAAKYMEPGGVIRVGIEKRRGEAVISVRDQGVGISADMLPKVFDLFTQVEGTIDRAQGGLGIGLALVQRLADLHGGRVEAHSDGPGRGSAFVIRLPLAAVPSDGDRSGADLRFLATTLR